MTNQPNNTDLSTNKKKSTVQSPPSRVWALRILAALSVKNKALFERSEFDLFSLEPQYLAKTRAAAALFASFFQLQGKRKSPSGSRTKNLKIMVSCNYICTNIQHVKSTQNRNNIKILNDCHVD